MRHRNEDGSWSAWDAVRLIDVKILSTAGTRDGRSFDARAMLGEVEKDWIFTRTAGGLLGRGWLEETSDNKGKLFWLHSDTAATNRVLFISIAFRDRSDLEWAISVARSVENAEP